MGIHQFSYRGMWDFIHSHCCEKAMWAGRAHWSGRDQAGLLYYGLPFERVMRDGSLNGIFMLTVILFCFCFRIKWFQCALIWQSDPQCCGTIFRSAAIPQWPLHCPTVSNAGPVSCSLLSHNGPASFLCSWHSPKHGICEFWPAWPWISSSSSYQPCSYG